MTENNANANLHAARKAKNDEFYTQYSDIEAEMNAYYEYDHDVFRNKTILCPCDDPEWSNFTKYFAANFQRFGLKKLISTSYAKSASNQQLTLFETSSPLYDESKHGTYGKIFTLASDTDGSGIIDTDDIRFDGYLDGDGDFRSAEITALRDEADIIITNPPFSLFREFLAWITEGKKQFAIIGNMNALTYKEVFPLIRDNAVWLGTTKPHEFIIPNANGDVDMKHNSVQKFGNICWYTNLDHGFRHQPLQLDTMTHNLKFNKKLRKKFEGEYGKLEYPHYDNYDAIEVPFVECIPSDYDGVMGVPISFMDKYCPEQFEIVAFRKGKDGKDLVFTREREREYNHTFASLFDIDSRNDQERRMRNQWASYVRSHHDMSSLPEPVDCFFPITTNLKNGLMNDCTIGGKKTYVRMLIRKNSSVSA